MFIVCVCVCLSFPTQFQGDQGLASRFGRLRALAANEGPRCYKELLGAWEPPCGFSSHEKTARKGKDANQGACLLDGADEQVGVLAVLLA